MAPPPYILGPKALASIASQVEATRSAIRLRKWALATERTYCAWVRRYGVWVCQFGRDCPDSTAKVTGFLRTLVTGPSPRSGTTLKQALNALVFYYAYVRREPLGRLGDIPQPRRANRLPHVLTREQMFPRRPKGTRLVNPRSAQTRRFTQAALLTISALRAPSRPLHRLRPHHRNPTLDLVPEKNK